MGAGAGAGAGAADVLGAQGLSLDQPGLQLDRAEVRAAPGLRPAEKAVVFEENNKAGIKADELGEQQRQIQGKDAPERVTERLGLPGRLEIRPFQIFSAAPVAKDEADHVKGIPLPLNPVQLPNPIQPHHAKDPVPPDAVRHRQSESPPPGL